MIISNGKFYNHTNGRMQEGFMAGDSATSFDRYVLVLPVATTARAALHGTVHGTVHGAYLTTCAASTAFGCRCPCHCYVMCVRPHVCMCIMQVGSPGGDFPNARSIQQQPIHRVT
eukprot:COSAG06_NODE_27336_length_595_cov_0.947581_2_plen_115_part_00